MQLHRLLNQDDQAATTILTLTVLPSGLVAHRTMACEDCRHGRQMEANHNCSWRCQHQHRKYPFLWASMQHNAVRMIANWQVEEAA
jgi:hypothetical protein